jgi:inosine/xanthosine triphosphate pyrophosphatase family protein
MAKEKRKVVLASRNEDKIRELRELCSGLPFEVTSALDYPDLPEVIEDGTTEVGNASRKAIVTAAYTGEISVADDTSLQIPALNNLPDIFASRFAGPGASYEDNAALVLELMAEVPDGFRQARFVTATVWVDPRPGLGLTPNLRVLPPAKSRWLHNPFARAIHLRDPGRETHYFNVLQDRRRVWEEYQAYLLAIDVSQGADPKRLREVMARLLGPFLKGERPEGVSPEAAHLPDTRIWSTSGPAPSQDSDYEPPPTWVTPSGLPAGAPGRAVNEDFWVEFSAEGRLLGTITRQPVGRQGFGYDPIFLPEGSVRTLAEFHQEEKNAVSHRGRALRRLIAAVRESYLVAV